MKKWDAQHLQIRLEIYSNLKFVSTFLIFSFGFFFILRKSEGMHAQAVFIVFPQNRKQNKTWRECHDANQT